jgi:hypothetical protein
MKRISSFITILMIAALQQCREPFDPDFKAGVNDFLVVEGFINVGERAVTQIKLSRVAPLDIVQQQWETGAEVSIEGSDGEQYGLHEGANGKYRSDSLDLNHETQYRIVLKRKNGLSYKSTFASAITTPEIDSIHWQKEPIGVNIILSTHSGENDSKFFSWSYVETWEIWSDHKTLFRYINGKVERRPNPEMSKMRFCWKYDYPQDVLFGSTEQLSENVMHFSLIRFPHFSERILVKYSILAEQRSLTEDEYRFLQLMQKNSTATGSLYDAMPSEIKGNIVCSTSPDVQAIGYVGVSTTTSKRKFILASEIDAPKPNKCEIEFVTEDQQVEFFKELGFEPVDSLGIVPSIDPLERPVYTGAPAYCVDCRYRGTSERPDFW